MSLGVSFRSLCAALACAMSALAPHAALAQATPAPGVPYGQATPSPSHSVLPALPVYTPPPAATMSSPTSSGATSSASSSASSTSSVTGQSASGAPAAGGSSSRSIYQVEPFDVVEVRVYQEDDLLTTARVSKEGVINFPLIGPVSVGGMTPDDAARAIASRLAKDFLVNPQVTMTVVEYSKRRFTVLGEVQKPGQYDMPDRDSVTLLEAIGAAGGYTRIADSGNIRLKRLEGGKETVFKLNAKKMANEREIASFEIKAGDIITVGQSFF